MIKLPQEVNKRIDGLGKGEGKLVITFLAFGIIVLGMVVVALWYRMKEIQTKGDTTNDDRISGLKIQYLKKDSALTSCLNQQIVDAHQAILREQKYNEEYRLQMKRQDSLLQLLNKVR